MGPTTLQASDLHRNEGFLRLEATVRWVDGFDAGEDPTLVGAKRQILQFLDSSPEPFSRTNYSPGHITASGIVVSPDLSQFLLVLHRRLRRWLQPGGHVEPGDADASRTAAREVIEETQVTLQQVTPALVGLDVHRIPAAHGEPAHLHHDLAFLFLADQADPGDSGDVRSVAWCDWDQLDEFDLDASLRRHVRRARQRVSTRALPIVN